jgi:hypothetical protein
VIAIVLIGIIGYAITGFASAQTRVGNADKTLNTVISHQNSLNSTFKDLNAKFTGLGSGSTFDPLQGRTLFDQFVAAEKTAGTTVEQDDTSLASAKASLGEQQWLTVLSRGSLDMEAARIDHARKALSIAKTIAADYVQDGQYFQAYFDAAIDLQTLGAQSATADVAGAKTTLATMKSHVDKALQLSTAQGLPTELHDLTVDFETLVADFGKLLDAAAANDDPAILSAEKSVETDANKMATYKFDTIVAKIGAFYKPMFDGVDTEMAKATA